MHVVRVLRAVLVGVGVLGGFPYTWDSSRNIVIRRKPLVAWTVAACLFIVSLTLLSVIMFELRGGEDMPVVKVTTLRVMSRSWNMTVLCLVLNSVIGQRTLAKAFQNMLQLPGCQKHRFSKLDTLFVIGSMLMSFIHMASMLTLRLSGRIPPIDTITQVIYYASIFPCDGTLFIFPLLFHVMCRFASIALEDVFLSCNTTIKKRKKTDSECVADSKESKMTHTVAQVDFSAGLQYFPSDVTGLVYHINDVLEGLVRYFRIPVMATLLNETLCMTTVSYLNVKEGVSFGASIFCSIFVLSSCVRIALVLSGPELLRAKRVKLQRLVRRLRMCTASVIEKQEMDHAVIALQDSPAFRIYGIFTLGPHCILSMASFIITYVIIAYELDGGAMPGLRCANMSMGLQYSH